jgi:hypothetical protein
MHESVVWCWCRSLRTRDISKVSHDHVRTATCQARMQSLLLIALALGLKMTVVRTWNMV